MAWRLRRRSAVTLAGAAVALVVAGCGGSDSDTEVPTSSGGSGTGSSATPAPGDEQKLVQWMECMRENGVPVEDPRSEGRLSAEGSGVSRATLDRAQRACREYVSAAAGDRPNAGDPEVLDRYLAFARCMRDNGVDMPDPKPDAAGNVTLEPGIDPGSAVYEQAEGKCADKLPGGGGAQ